MMLNDEKIKRAINDKEIEVFVSFKWENGELIEYTEEPSILSTVMKSNLYSDRLKLTMGPVVKVLSKKRVKKKYRFKKNIDCYDLRKSDNKFVINPGESIIILTNEKIKLNGKYACIILPRISLTDIGIVVSTAYVDPYYYGVMRLHLTNLSDKPYELKSLEAIAQCFFFELPSVVNINYKEQFSAKSVFFGQTWLEILNTGRSAFPTKKESAEVSIVNNIKYQWNIIVNFVKKFSLVIGISINVFALLCGLLYIKSHLDDYQAKVNYISEWLEPAASEIIVEPGKSMGVKTIVEDCSKDDVISILCNNDDIHFQISSGNRSDETVITFKYELELPNPNGYQVDFSYIIIKRKK